MLPTPVSIKSRRKLFMFRHDNFSLYFKANLLVAIILYLLFLGFNQDYTALTLLLTTMGAISTAATIILIVYILTYPLAYMKSFGLYILSSIFLLVDLSIIIDYFIHRIYHFHINAMVLNIITSPAAMDSIQLGLDSYLMFFSIIAVMIAFQLLTLRWIKRIDNDSKRNTNHLLNKIIILPLFLIIVIEKISFGFADVYAKGEILSKFAVVPLYQPLTFTVAASKYLDIKSPDVASTVTTNAQELNYPLSSLRYASDAKKTNIFIFASDAVRNSIITEEIAPNITAFAKEAYRYNDHFSGGIATRSGIFSLMYGINATYWFKFLAANQGSILFTALHELDYQIRVISSTNTNWPEFRKTCYVDVQACIEDHFTGGSELKDRQGSDYFKEWINQSDLSRPLFSFMFWDSPHGRRYPPEYRKYLPDAEGSVNYLTIDEEVGKTVLLNQYKNSVLYNDALFGEMIAFLKEKGLYEESIIIYTSDHGEEFYEYGTYGHNNSFNRAQAQSPLIIKFPHKEPKVISTLSSHVDVVPTLLSYVGVSTPPQDYSNGYNLLAEDYHRDYVNVANWDQNSIINDQQIMIFANRPDKIFNNEIRTTIDYKKVPKAQEKFDNVLVLKVLQENQKFLK